jgi:hypothetical protein
MKTVHLKSLLHEQLNLEEQANIHKKSCRKCISYFKCLKNINLVRVSLYQKCSFICQTTNAVGDNIEKGMSDKK